MSAAEKTTQVFGRTELYEQSLIRYAGSVWPPEKMDLITEGGVSLRYISRNARSFCRALRDDFVSGDHAIKPADRRLVTLDKQRWLYRFAISDRVLHGVIGSVLTAALEARISPHVYSYRRGRSNLQAVREFAKFVRKHRSTVRDPKQRGLYVLRRDVKSYTDRIRLDDESPLWPMLIGLLGFSPNMPDKERRIFEYIKATVQPPFFGEDGTVVTPTHGSPTGSPVNTAVANIYLGPLDRSLAEIANGFYARFGDDFIFAHPDEVVALNAAAKVDQILAELGLAANPEKAMNLSFNGSGARSLGTAGFPVSTQNVEFLGLTIDFRGTIRPKDSDVAEFLQQIDQTLLRATRLMKSSSPQQLAQVLTKVLTRVMTKGTKSTHPVMVRSLVEADDGSFLRHLDYLIARRLLKFVSGAKSVRAFRQFPYRVMRNVWRLPSLTHLRNRSKWG